MGPIQLLGMLVPLGRRNTGRRAHQSLQQFRGRASRPRMVRRILKSFRELGLLRPNGHLGLPRTSPSANQQFPTRPLSVTSATQGRGPARRPNAIPGGSAAGTSQGARNHHNSSWQTRYWAVVEFGVPVIRLQRVPCHCVHDRSTSPMANGAAKGSNQ